MYQNKIREDRDQYVVNINKMKFEAYGDLVEQPFLKLNENSINNQDIFFSIWVFFHEHSRFTGQQGKGRVSI